MKKFERDYKLLLEKVKLSQEENDKLKKSIVVSNNKPVFKLSYAFIVILTVFLVGTSIVYGKELISIFSEYFTKKAIYKDENGETFPRYEGYYGDFIKITNPIPYNKNDVQDFYVNGEVEDKRNFSYEEIEKDLDIRILKNPLIKSDNFKLAKLDFNDKEQISRISFRMGQDFPEEGNSEAVLYSFSIFTQYSTEEEREKPNIVFGGSYELTTYHIESLDIDAYIYETIIPDIDTDEYIVNASARFAYDGILYGIQLNKLGYKTEDFYNILESLSY